MPESFRICRSYRDQIKSVSRDADDRRHCQTPTNEVSPDRKFIVDVSCWGPIDYVTHQNNLETARIRLEKVFIYSRLILLSSTETNTSNRISSKMRVHNQAFLQYFSKIYQFHRCNRLKYFPTMQWLWYWSHLLHDNQTTGIRIYLPERIERKSIIEHIQYLIIYYTFVTKGRPQIKARRQNRRTVNFRCFFKWRGQMSDKEVITASKQQNCNNWIE